MTAFATVLARLTETGCRVTLRSDGRLSLQPPPPNDLLALAREHRDDLLALLQNTTTARAPPAAPKACPQGVLAGDPAPPVVSVDATRTLAALELVGTGPTLQRDGSIRLARPQRADANMQANMQRYAADITALLRYRATLEATRPADMAMGPGAGSAALPYWLDPGRPVPPPDLVARLVAALIAQARANPVVRISDSTKARGYFEAQARTQLMRRASPAERLALVEAEEARASHAPA